MFVSPPSLTASRSARGLPEADEIARLLFEMRETQSPKTVTPSLIPPAAVLHKQSSSRMRMPSKRLEDWDHDDFPHRGQNKRLATNRLDVVMDTLSAPLPAHSARSPHSSSLAPALALPSASPNTPSKLPLNPVWTTIARTPPLVMPFDPTAVGTIYHKQQSEVPGQLRDGTSRALIDIPLQVEWWQQLSAALDPVMLRVLDLKDKRKHALGLYVCDMLFSSGLRISFHPTDSLRTVIGHKQFEHVRGKATREPLMLLSLDPLRPVVTMMVSTIRYHIVTSSVE